MPDTTLRQLKLLECIPRFPFKKTPQEMKEVLESEGFDISERSIQRDLIKLSSVLPLISDERNKPFGWSWIRNAPDFGPAMDPIEALSLSLAHQYLEPLMPGQSFNRVKIFFDRADSVLKESSTSKIKKWRDRVRVVPQWQRLISPKINEKAQSAIYDALLRGNQLKVNYVKRGTTEGETRLVNPLGIVLQGNVHRLICTMAEDPDNVRHLPVHRFRRAEWNGLKSKEPKGFDMDQYIEEQRIGFLLSNKPINIEVLFEASSGFHLTETPISKNQKLNQLESGKFLLKASLANTEQLRWWLLGFGNRVEVLKPKSLRNEFTEIAKGLSKIYK